MVEDRDDAKQGGRNSDDFLDERSMEEIVSGADSDKELAADLPLNGQPAVKIGGEHVAARQADLAAIAGDRPAVLSPPTDTQRRVVGIIEALIEISFLGVWLLVGMLYWYRNWTPVIGLVLGVGWSFATYQLLISRNINLSTESVEGPSSLSHCIVFFPALVLFAASFLVWLPDLTHRNWTVRQPFTDSVRTYGPGEWFIAAPFVSYIRGTAYGQNQNFELAFKTRDGVPVSCVVRAVLKMVATPEVLTKFVLAHPSSDEFLREQSLGRLQKLARSILSERTFAELQRFSSEFVVEGRRVLVRAGGLPAKDQLPSPILELQRLVFGRFVVPANRGWRYRSRILLESPLLSESPQDESDEPSRAGQEGSEPVPTQLAMPRMPDHD